MRYFRLLAIVLWMLWLGARWASADDPPLEIYLPLIARGRPTLGGCAMFPADNPWNRDVSADPVDAITPCALRSA
jgi:hypothetical protein